MKFRFEIPVLIDGGDAECDYYYLERDSFEFVPLVGMTLQLSGMDEEHDVIAVRFYEADEEQFRKHSCVEVNLAHPLGHEEVWRPTSAQRRMMEVAGWKLEKLT